MYVIKCNSETHYLHVIHYQAKLDAQLQETAKRKVQVYLF